eukprot:jgi/Antlo1/871/1982
MVFRLYLAPMLGVTTPHFRRLVRLTGTGAVLFTEMVVADAVLHMSRDMLLERIGPFEAGTVVQIGGSCPDKVANAVRAIQKLLGFTEFNLNCGCPSTRVQSGGFGATLMLRPDVVADIVNRVETACGVVLSLKIRLGVDEHEDYEFVHAFVRRIVEATSCTTFFVHARKCVLGGLSPARNRKVPELRYEYVHRLKQDFPEKHFVLNGGICSPEQLAQRGCLDGFMIGREAARDVFVLRKMENKLEGGEDTQQVKTSIRDLAERYAALYSGSERVRSVHVLPLMGLVRCAKNSRRCRQKLSSLPFRGCTFEDLQEEIAEYM